MSSTETTPVTVNYGTMATGKRVPEIWTYSANLDPDSDNISNTHERGLLYTIKGPDAHKDFTPLGLTILSIIKIFVVICVISLASAGAWFGTFGCKGEYLEIEWGWVTQFVIFCIILINIFVVKSESSDAPSEAIWTVYSIVAAFATWLLLNIVAKIGDTWLFFDSPFWPTPMTYWGAVMLLGIVLMQIDNMRSYWIGARNQMNRDKADRMITIYSNLESVTAIIFCSITAWRFGIEYFKEKNKLGSKFSFIKFLLGIDTGDKVVVKGSLTREQGRCKEDVKSKLKKEVDKGIKNSSWRKFKVNVTKMLNL